MAEPSEVLPKYHVDFLIEYSDEALLKELRRVASSLTSNMLLTKEAYKRSNPRASHSTIQRRFGGWRQALEAAGLAHLATSYTISKKMRHQPARALTKQDLVIELRRVHALVGTRWLTTEDFNAHSLTTEAAIRGRFGSFRRGLEVAGIECHPLTSRKFSDCECFENLADVWTHFGRPPQYLEMMKHPSRIRSKTYVIRWGTWRKALAAFVAWTNDDSQSEDQPTEVTRSNPAEPSPSTSRRLEADCRDIRPGLRFKLFKRDGFRCMSCGRSPATHLNVELHADHILAVAKGGKTTLDNLQSLCRDCNLGKGAS